MTFAELTGASTYIVHLSCKEALAEALAARQRGVDVTVETLIQYLVLDKTWAERPGFEGAKYVMSPPLRDASNQPVLWNGLRDGLIQTVATDHAPFDFEGQKRMGHVGFHENPKRNPFARGAGEPPLHLRREGGPDRPAHAGERGEHRRWRRPSTSSRGRARSSPAPMPTWSSSIPNYRGVISVKTQHMNVDYSAFEGWKIEGRPSTVTVRGEVAARDGKFVGSPTRGRFLKRTPSRA